MKLLSKLKEWRGSIPEKRQLGVGEVFYRLSTGQRALLIFLCTAVYLLYVSGVFTSNVLPHYAAIIGKDGRLNPGELSSALILTGTVIGLTTVPLLLKLPLSLFSKCGIVLASVFIIFTNVSNGVGTQAGARDARNEAPRQTSDRIARLDREITELNAAFKALPDHAYTTEAIVKTANDQAVTLRKSADEECHRGLLGNTRGPKCASLEQRRDAAQQDLAQVEKDKATTDRRVNIEAELWKAKKEREALGAAPVHVDAEMEVFGGFLSSLGVITPSQAKSLSVNKPVIEAVCMELMAAFLTAPSIMGVFMLFGLFTSTKAEADRRMIEVTQAVVANAAPAAIAAVSPQPIAAIPAPVAVPDHSPEAILGIVGGEQLPAFAENPETVAEAAAAALLKADPHRKPQRRARKLMAASRESVVLWHKERAYPAQGRKIESRVARADYETWCEELNLTAVNPTVFGLVLRDELNVPKEGKSGRVRYLNLALRPASLRVISGGA